MTSKKTRGCEKLPWSRPNKSNETISWIQKALQRDLDSFGVYGTISWFKLDVGGPGNKNTIRN